MSKLGRIFASLYADGFKALSVFAPLLSSAFIVAKIYDAVPALREIAYPWALLPLTIWLFVAYARRWSTYELEIEAPRADPLTLTPMHVSDIAEHIYKHSAWAWKEHLRLTFRKNVKDAVPGEMSRAAQENQVRFLGALPNTARVQEIDRAYWTHGYIDGDRIWDRRNDFFTQARSRGGSMPHLVHYQNGSAPKADVMRTWPRASSPYRAYVRARLWIRRARYGFPKMLREREE